MKQYDKDNQSEVAKFILHHLPRHPQFALGTIDEAGTPWVVCLNLAFDQEMTFIWKSVKTTEHSKHVRKNPQVSICVFSEFKEVGDFGFYTTAVAREIEDEKELKHFLDVRYKEQGKPAPPPSDFLDTAEMRIYAADITRAWVNDSRHIKTEVDMKVLKKIAKKV